MAKVTPSGKQPLPYRIWQHAWAAACRYDEIDGEQRAASFAYYAFFSLFPLIVLLVTTLGGSLLKDQAQATEMVIRLLQDYMPLSSADQLSIAKTINGVIAGRGSAGLVASITLAWSSLRFFQALVRGVNRAWGTKEYAWWHLPIKNLGMVLLLASAMLLGGILPTILTVIRRYFTIQFWVVPQLFDLIAEGLPILVLFYVLTLFYKYAPRGQITFRSVWLSALVVTLLLKVVQYLFAIYLSSYSNFNVIYGAFAGVIALMLWIYISGSLIIYGGCLCAVKREINTAPSTVRRKKRPV